MFLNKLYSEPFGLFPEVEFKKGINFIFGKKDSEKASKESLNGIGKSLLLNFLDFCLLSSETEHIKSAKKNSGLDLDNYKIVLEFEIEKVTYVIKRSLKSPNKDISFGEKGKDLTNYDNTKAEKELSRIICNLFFKNNSYTGQYSEDWLRQLIPFFIKKQESPKTKVSFKDPIKYLHGNSKEIELIPFHLLFMGIDNSLFYKNSTLTPDCKEQEKALSSVEKLVTESYKVKDISQAKNEIDKLRIQIEKEEQNIKQFELAKQYENSEIESNKLTAKIKELMFQNHYNSNQISNYKKSYLLDDNLNTKKIQNIYKDLNKLLANNIKKTLDDALEFRRLLASSRQEFLESEITKLEEAISKNKEEIAKLENERIKFYRFLESKEAIKDLSEAHFNLSTKKDKLNDISSKIKTFQDLTEQVSIKKAEIAKLSAEINTFSNRAQTEDAISKFREVFFEIHNAIYPEYKDSKEVGFIFEPNDKKDTKIKYDVELPKQLAFGKNKGRTLIYDLAVLIHAIKQNIKCPRFLVHDGIFDGMDKTHFVYLCEFLESLSNQGEEFQYIITLNEEGELKQKFGNTDKVNPDKIEKESIITLTPSKTLLGCNWN